MINFKPYHNNVLVKEEKEEERFYGNILVPDLGKEKAMYGKVLATGTGFITSTGQLIPNQAKVGDVVAFSPFSGTKITYKGEEYFVFKDIDLLGCVNEEKKEEKEVLPKPAPFSEQLPGLLKDTMIHMNGDDVMGLKNHFE